jgi:type II secretory ATPase GspE/PulE/Tfp pilus assembly ATPase PilB-like protein
LHSAFDLNFAELGISSEDAAQLSDILKTPQGMLLVTGPTGSGKTTTLHAALNEVRQPHLNITSVEDPIEYKIEGVTQVQINPKAGLTFANCLRSLLRQDPNIILIGEIRDQETAEIALRAAQTGHLMLSTLHTNDSLSAITRLLDLHVAPYLIASSLSAVLAQRLVRKLCKCKEQRPIPPRILERLAAVGHAPSPAVAYGPVGCELCEQTGYRGRIAVYELLVVSDELRAGMRSGFDHAAARELARASGMRTMHEDAMTKVGAGTTSIEEVMRAVPFDSPGTCCRECRRSVVKTFSYCPSCGLKLNPASHGENSDARLATAGNTRQ